MSSPLHPRVCLLILDGAGYNQSPEGNAVRPETMPALFASMDSHGFAVLEASGESVGLEAGQVGNSEAGHLTIGAGRIVPCMTRRVIDAYETGRWAADPGWQSAVDHGCLHVVGLLSDAGVHGFARTIIQAVHAARDAGVGEIIVHPVLDGVDSLAGTAPNLLSEIESALNGLEGVRCGVISGRKQFCDRSGDLEVTRSYVGDLLGAVELPTYVDSALREHISAGASEADFCAHLMAGGRTVRPGEPVLITSHRADRVRQVARVLTETQPVMMLVNPGADTPVEHVFFPQSPLQDGFAHEIREAGFASRRIAEKCKFPHVTHFFNGFDTTVEGEGICIDSIPEREIPDHPEMSIREVSKRVLSSLADRDCRVVIANLANLDQVGHLGRLDLAERAAAEVDYAFTRIRASAEDHGWTLLVTADHGNADRVENADGQPFGSHTKCPVPLLVVPAPGQEFSWSSREGTLANVAPTCLSALGITPPDWMESALGSYVPCEQAGE